MYMGNVLMPVTPSQIKMKINSQNQTVTLMNDGEVNLLKSPGLTDVSFTLLIPQVKYPFAKQNLIAVNRTTGETVTALIPASFYLDLFQELKVNKTPFQWIVSRYLPKGKLLFDTNMKVTLEDYQINEDVRQGFDLEIDVQLKQYKPYGVKTIVLDTPSATAPVIVREDRDETIPIKTTSSGSSSSGGGGGGGGSSKEKKIKVSNGAGGSMKTTVALKNAGDHENSAYWSLMH